MDYQADVLRNVCDQKQTSSPITAYSKHPLPVDVILRSRSSVLGPAWKGANLPPVLPVNETAPATQPHPPKLQDKLILPQLQGHARWIFRYLLVFNLCKYLVVGRETRPVAVYRLHGAEVRPREMREDAQNQFVVQRGVEIKQQ